MPVAACHRSPRSSAFLWLCQRPWRCPCGGRRRGRPPFRIDTFKRPTPHVVHLLAGEREGVPSRLPQNQGAPNTGNGSPESNPPASPTREQAGLGPGGRERQSPTGQRLPSPLGLAPGSLCPASPISQADGLAALLICFPFSFHLLAMEQEAGPGRLGQCAASQSLACVGLTQRGQRTWESLTWGLLGVCGPCFS